MWCKTKPKGQLLSYMWIESLTNMAENKTKPTVVTPKSGPLPKIPRMGELLPEHWMSAEQLAGLKQVAKTVPLRNKKGE